MLTACNSDAHVYPGTTYVENNFFYVIDLSIKSLLDSGKDQTPNQQAKPNMYSIIGSYINLLCETLQNIKDYVNNLDWILSSFQQSKGRKKRGSKATKEIGEKGKKKEEMCMKIKISQQSLNFRLKFQQQKAFTRQVVTSRNT